MCKTFHSKHNYFALAPFIEGMNTEEETLYVIKIKHMYALSDPTNPLVRINHLIKIINLVEILVVLNKFLVVIHGSMK